MKKTIGEKIHSLAKELWPINRSITGAGVRETLYKIKEHLPKLEVQSVPSLTKAFDWVVPLEWEINEAYIVCPNGDKICDFKENNLHLVNYSVPINKTISLQQLEKKLFSLPNQPNAIPYVTSYYKEDWGFCISQNQRESLLPGKYKVYINSRLFDGELNYGELFLPGKSRKEIFISTYICHPSMANNELSGPTVLTYLIKWLMKRNSLYYSYRIVFIPETIGSIVYLSKNYKHLKKNVIAGYNVTCIGDDRTYSFLPSRKGVTLSDEMAKHVLGWKCHDYRKYTWNDRGSDERQYCSPGIDLPIASIMRTKYGQYPEYHTSLDDLENVVTPEGLGGGYEILRLALEGLENNVLPRVKTLCEPQLGKRDLYPNLSKKDSSAGVKTMMDFISWSDGTNTLLDIANKVNVPIWELYDILELLIKYNLIELIDRD
tara:strand:- start:125 stop:1420 length:1296 start_codon:yes stop_codon:yes gene_type:complete